MIAMIFAAGLGTRLGSITRDCPKALVEVGGEPMLGRVMRKLVSAGVSAAVVNVHYHSAMIKDYLASHSFGIPVEVSDESDLLLDTGGGLAKAAPMLRRMLDPDESVILHNADILTDFPLAPMTAAHRGPGADATLHVSFSRPSSRKLLFTPDMRLAGWRDCRTGEVRGVDASASGLTEGAFGGVHIVGPAVLDAVCSYAVLHGPVFSITPFYVDSCHSLDIRAFEPEGDYRWADIGKPDSLARARELFASLRG